MCLSHVHMGSDFPLDLNSNLISSLYTHQMPPRREFEFPPELTQLIQQQNTLMQLLVQNTQNNQNNNNNPPPPPRVDNLTRFLRLQPPVFASSIEPIVADDWLRKIGRDLTTANCSDGGEGAICRTPVVWTSRSMVGELHSHFPHSQCYLGAVSASFPYCPCLSWSYEHEEAGVSQLAPRKLYCNSVCG